MPAATMSLFAAAAPGLEPVLLDELRSSGIAGVAEPGGVAWEGTRDSLYQANLWLRTAGRVLVRIARFRASAFYDLERLADKVPWDRYVAPGGRVRFRVTCRKSRLYHSDAVAERLVASVARRVAGAAAVDAGTDDDEGPDAAAEPVGDDAQLFVVRFVRDECVISADSSGALLHRRGYRLATAKAPLRETLAAASVLASGWDGGAPFLDPMCGAGTIAIEAALVARRMAPGLGRRFAFERWPGFAASRWDAMVADARAAALPAAPGPIEAADRDAGAVAATIANAERAGVAADLRVEQRAVSATGAADAPSWTVTNPPYGVRVGDRDRLRNLYAALGRTLHERRPGGTLALLSADPQLAAQAGVPLAERFRTTNGGIEVRLMAGVVGGATSEERAGEAR